MLPIHEYFLHNPRYNVSCRRFYGEDASGDPERFAGRAFLLRGEWEITLITGEKITGRSLAGDWPYVELDLMVSVQPVTPEQEGCEIDAAHINKVLFHIPNEMERYIALFVRHGYHVTAGGKALGSGDIERWMADLTDLAKGKEPKAAFAELLAALSPSEQPNEILFELRFAQDGSEPPASLLEGRSDVKGNTITNVGSILEQEGVSSFSGLPTQWHMRKIPNWPVALDNGIPVISAVVRRKQDLTVLYLLHRLYGRRFKNSVFVLSGGFLDEEWSSLFQARIQRQRKVVTYEPEKGVGSHKGDGATLELPSGSASVVIFRDYLNSSHLAWPEFVNTLFQKEQGVALFGWSFCYTVLRLLGKERFWQKNFYNFKIIGKIPLQYPGESLIKNKKWLCRWQRLVGKRARLEDFGLSLWSFTAPFRQWQRQGDLAGLCAFHSLLPFAGTFDELKAALSFYPLHWSKPENMKDYQMIASKRLMNWPYWNNQYTKYIDFLKREYS